MCVCVCVLKWDANKGTLILYENRGGGIRALRAMRKEKMAGEEKGDNDEEGKE